MDRVRRIAIDGRTWDDYVPFGNLVPLELFCNLGELSYVAHEEAISADRVYSDSCPFGWEGQGKLMWLGTVNNYLIQFVKVATNIRIRTANERLEKSGEKRDLNDVAVLTRLSARNGSVCCDAESFNLG